MSKLQTLNNAIITVDSGMDTAIGVFKGDPMYGGHADALLRIKNEFHGNVFTQMTDAAAAMDARTSPLPAPAPTVPTSSLPEKTAGGVTPRKRTFP